MANQFLIKETMEAMRNLSSTEIDGLKGNNPIYAGVELLGYYQKGDTPAPIIYYCVNPLTDPDPGPDDGGSVIEVQGTKLRHQFNGAVDIRYFGASANLLDNYPFIQNCLNSSRSVTIDEIAFRVVNTIPLAMKSNTIVQGTGILHFTESNSFILVQNQVNITIESVKFKGNYISSGGKHGLYFQNCENIQLHNIGVSEASQHGVRFLSCSFVDIQNCTLTNNILYGIDFDLCNMARVVNNNSSNNGYSIEGVEFSDTRARGVNVTRSSNVKILNNIFENNNEYGIRVYSELGQTVFNKDIQISGNTCRNNGSSVSGRGLEIYIFNASDLVEDIIIIGNTCIKSKPNTGSCVSIQGHRVRFNDNVVKSEGLIGNSGVNLYSANQCEISSNTIHNFDYAFSFSAANKPNNINVSGNTITKVKGLYFSLQGEGHNFLNNYIEHDDINGTSDNVCLSIGGGGTGQSTFRNNIIRGGFYRGIVIGSLPCIVEGNDVSGCTNFDIYKVGNSMENIIFSNNNASLFSPIELSGLICTRVNSQVRKIGFKNTEPSALDWNVGDLIFNNTGLRGQPSGWVCCEAGTAGVNAVFSRLASLGTERYGSNDPNGVVPGSIGDIFKRSNGGLHASIYTKASGNDTNTEWVPLANYFLASPTVKGLVNQVVALEDTAIVSSPTYSLTEVQGILQELRDLKMRLREAGILAT